jgi:thioredoxin-like negative regulator of GroEL
VTKIYQISAGSFHDKVIHVQKPVVVEFFSHSCPHCIKFRPVYTQLANSIDGEARFVKIDVIHSEANRNLAHSRGIRTVPTLEVFYHGRVIGNIVGYHETQKIVSAVKEFLSKKDENVGPGTSLNEVDLKH